MQPIADGPAASAAKCTNVKRTDIFDMSTDGLLNQFTEKELSAYCNKIINEDLHHKNNLAGVLWFVPRRVKRRKAARKILTFYRNTHPALFQDTDILQSELLQELQNMMINYIPARDEDDAFIIPGYHSQVLIIWLISLLLPVFLVLLAINIVSLNSITAIFFGGSYLVLTAILVALNTQRGITSE